MALEIDLSDYEKEGPLHEMFMRQAVKTPYKIAVIDHDGRTMTFKDLNDYSDQLALYLKNQGLYKGFVAGVLMERCLEWCVTYIAVHKAGGGYLPIETSYPLVLLESVLEDAKPSVLVTKKKCLDRLSSSSLQKIVMDGDWYQDIVAFNKKHPVSALPKVMLDDMAYIVYTSGTTGKPKGIVCPHRGAVHAYTYRHRAYPYEEDDREACNVFFVWEMLRPLLKGVPMYILSDEDIYNPPKVAKVIEDNKITRILFTPSLLETIINFKDVNVKKSFKSLKIIIFCGEVVTTTVRDHLASLCPWIKLLNLYSISETHDVSCADISNPNLIKEGRPFCSVGTAMPLVKIVTLDGNLEEKALGIPGDIYIGGPALAIGYLNRPDLNRVRFISPPEKLRAKYGDRLYYTGDWGFALGDGTFEVMGRNGSLIKIRGYTIELQAIEAVLRQYPKVKTCCVLSVGDEGQNKILVAYVVSFEAHVKPSELRSYLKSKFPFYMIPSKFFFLSSLPVLKASGKVDIQNLPQLNSRSKIELGDDLNDIEKKIATIWCQILNLYTIDKNENFFDVGGHSLTAATCISQMNENLLINLSVPDIFSHPTVESMALFIEKKADLISNLNLRKEIEMNSYENKDDNLNARVHYFWKSLQINKKKLKTGNILLTGVTGFLGIHLLEKLLTKTQCTIYCTIRDAPDITPRDRILENIKKYNLSLNMDAHEDRVILVKADLSLDNLGFTNADEFTSLSLEIDMIIHAAAFVNLVLPYTALYKSNVVSTKNLIQFAFLNKIKLFHFISTDGICPNSSGTFGEDFTVKDFDEYLKNTSGYGQTKYVCEKILLYACKLGLPVVIIRSGNIGGSLQYQNWNRVDYNLYFLQGIIQTGYVPDIDWAFEVTPVDFLTNSLIELFTNIKYANEIYNFINPNTINIRNVQEHLNSLGYDIRQMGYKQWTSKINDSNLLEPLARLLNSSSHVNPMYNSYCIKNTEIFLKSLNETYPKIDQTVFEKIIKTLSKLNLIRKPKNDLANIHADFLHMNNDLSIIFRNNLNNKIILVTGASSGIGEQLVKDLYLVGATVIGVARRIERLEKIKESFIKSNKETEGKIIVKKLDVTDETDVKKVVNDVIEAFGRIDVLVNNAGVMFYTSVDKYQLEDWNKMVDVNVKGVLHCTGNILPFMIKKNSGHIVNISSNAGIRPFAGLAVYSGTKYFIEGFSGALRQEVLNNNIKVTCVQPGDIETELLLHTKDEEAFNKYDCSRFVPILKTIDVSKTIIFILSQPFNCVINNILLEPPSISM